MKLATLLLDLDGTLVNTESLKHKAHQQTVEDLRGRWILTDEQYFSLMGGSSERTVESICKACDLEIMSYAGYRRVYLPYYRALIESEARTHQGVIPFLVHAKACNLRIAIVSSSSEEEVTLVLARTNMSMYVDCIVSSDDVKRQKPAPDPYIAARSRFAGATKYNTVVMEDTHAGVVSARTADLKVMAVSHGLNRSQNFVGATSRMGVDGFLEHRKVLTALDMMLY